MTAVRVIAWLSEGTWAATVDATASVAGALEASARSSPDPEVGGEVGGEVEVVLLHVTDAEITETLHGAFGGLLGRGERDRDPADTVADLAATEARRLLAGAEQRLGRPAHHQLRQGAVEREVVTECQDAALLVCARDGDHSRLGPQSLGPHTRFVVDHAPCPVLLIWPDGPPTLGTLPPAPPPPTPGHPPPHPPPPPGRVPPHPG